MKNVIILILAFALSFPLWWGMNFLQAGLEMFFYAQISQPLTEAVFVKIPERPKKPELNLASESTISLKINKAGREKILFRENSQKTLPIASLTKLMTALIVFEENSYYGGYDFSRVVTVSKEAAVQEDIPIYGNLKAGETFTIEKLLELTLFYSSNDAAFTLSESMGKNKTFIEKMNQKAMALGLKNTHFVNPTGLDPKDTDVVPNHSTAQELIELAKYILKENPDIFVFSLKKGPYPTRNSVSDLYSPEGQEFVGGKTGYTEKAGGCMLVVLKDEKENAFINLILGADSSESRIQEMQKLINWISL